LYFSPNIIKIKSRRMRWTGFVAHVGEMRNAYKILVRKPEGNCPLRRAKHKWKEKIIQKWRKLKIQHNKMYDLKFLR
jgi:hypothetical protein